ncbi:uncharacterized protein BJ212DRAFT_1449992 [Suillus subaureus]|uniref:CxC2-like cysteine cluster KDZ transposase-associated domain-containing protein n=1 Tax=Suillus subaureus TaxID=48587 RepID=A0A9P7DT00_9AGAM|nr:uncharacterized protein BJ212DRAFT_1449992 [Suillus subaureus]KAG1802416.1 hypothetical protein BJ212DRAFT_1449992 [Suillus subaureus]
MLVDTEAGVFLHNIVWCGCPGSQHRQHLQLLKARLFPASITQPWTAFTFEVLDHFLIDVLECKTSASSFFEKIWWMTNHSFPDTVPNQYQELMRVSRLWRDLMSQKCFGFGHDTQEKPGKDDLAWFCPSCPQPGINIPDNWQDNWLISQRYVVDGNFTTQHMTMKMLQLDISLSDGLGISGHLSLAVESKEHSSCSNHQVINTTNINRSNLCATGVGATACAWHRCFVPHSIVDFQKGERSVHPPKRMLSKLIRCLDT